MIDVVVRCRIATSPMAVTWHLVLVLVNRAGGRGLTWASTNGRRIRRRRGRRSFVRPLGVATSLNECRR
jgi:hypothetical protein